MSLSILEISQLAPPFFLEPSVAATGMCGDLSAEPFFAGIAASRLFYAGDADSDPLFLGTAEALEC